MSKFDELRQAYIDARKTFFAQRDACSKFAATLLRGLEVHLKSPQYQFQFIPQSSDVRAGTARSAEDVAWRGADHCWHYRAGLELSDAQPGKASKVTARQVVIIEMILQPEGNAFTVGLRGWDDRFTLPSKADSPEQAEFNEFVFQRMLGTYQQPGQKFYQDQDDKSRFIGGPS